MPLEIAAFVVAGTMLVTASALIVMTVHIRVLIELTLHSRAGAIASGTRRAHLYSVDPPTLEE